MGAVLTKLSKLVLFGAVFFRVGAVFAAAATAVAAGVVLAERGFAWPPLLFLAACFGILVWLFVVAGRLQARIIRLFFSEGGRA